MMTEQQRNEFFPQPAPDADLKKEIADKIEDYHQKNFWECFPAGKVFPWIINAVADNIVKPMQAEIAALKTAKKV